MLLVTISLNFGLLDKTEVKDEYIIMQKKILVYDPSCPYCRFIGKLVRIFDVKQKLTYYPIRTKQASSLLHEFFEIIPYNFHFIYDEKDLCYTGLKAIPMVLYELVIGLFWPYGGNKPFWLDILKIKLK